MEKVKCGLDYKEFTDLLGKLCLDMISQKDNLNELDSAIGDGDLGNTVYRGFRAVQSTLELENKNIGQLLIRAGINLNNAACSTMGFLFGMALMRAGICIGDKDCITLKTIYAMVESIEDSIKEKGEAELGDKTMLDAIDPIRLSLKKSIRDNDSTEDALENAVQASRKGCNATRDMRAFKGRSRWLGERTIGHIDPGAYFICLIVESISRYYMNKK